MLILLSLMVSIGWRAEEQPRSEVATVVIYRQREFDGGGYDLKLNGKLLGYLPQNRFLKVTIPTGRVKIESEGAYLSDVKMVFFTAEQGQTYYIKAVEDIDFMTRALLMARVSEEQAKRELSRIKPMETAQTDQNHD